MFKRTTRDREAFQGATWLEVLVVGGIAVLVIALIRIF